MPSNFPHTYFSFIFPIFSTDQITHSIIVIGGEGWGDRHFPLCCWYKHTLAVLVRDSASGGDGGFLCFHNSHYIYFLVEEVQYVRRSPSGWFSHFGIPILKFSDFFVVLGQIEWILTDNARKCFVSLEGWEKKRVHIIFLGYEFCMLTVFLMVCEYF